MSLRPLHHLMATAFEQLPDEPFMQETTTSAESSPDESSLLFTAWCREFLVKLSQQFEAIMERPLSVPSSSSVHAASRFTAAIRYCDLLKKIPGTKRVLTAIGITGAESRGFLRNALVLIILESVQEMLEHNGLLHHHLVDDWLLGDTLTSLPAVGEHVPLHGNDLADLMSCLLTLQPQNRSTIDHVAYLAESLKQLFEQHDPHFERLMQFQHMHGTAVAAATDEKEWMDALEKLDAEVFLAGYEMNTFLKTAFQPLS